MQEAQRAVVLLIALVVHLLDGTPADAGIASIRRELGVLGELLANRTRSIIDYADTSRGKAILELGAHDALRGLPQGTDLITEFRALQARFAELEATFPQPEEPINAVDPT